MAYNPNAQPRETTGPSSYYGMVQNYGQTSSSFPYMHMQPQQYPRGQQQFMQN